MAKAGRKKGEFYFRLYQSTSIYNLMKEQTPTDIRTGEIRLFWLICGFLEDLDTITSKQLTVINEKLNGYKPATTHVTIKKLRDANLITTQVRDKFRFAQAYISITDKGNLLKAIIKDHINNNPHAILNQFLKEEGQRRINGRKKASKTRKATFERMKQEGKPINQHAPKK